MLATRDLVQFREMLLEERDRLVSSLEDQNDGSQWVDNPDEEDMADLMAEQDRRASIVEFNARLLEQMNRALDRLDSGTYGICTKCGEEIPAERIMALPYAEMCVGCQSKVEKRGW